MQNEKGKTNRIREKWDNEINNRCLKIYDYDFTSFAPGTI